MNYAFLGLGFVQGWLWLFFLNGPLLFSETEGWSISNEFILLGFLLANSLSYLWVAKKAIGSTHLYTRNLILVTSTFMMASGILMVKFTAGHIGEVQYVALALTGAVFAGFGSAILIATLGELFSFLSVTVAGLSFWGAVTVGTVLFFGTLKLRFDASFLLTAVSPIIALLFIFLGRRQISKILKVTKVSELSNTDWEIIKNSSSSSSSSFFPFPFPFPRRLVLLLILFYLAGGFFYKMVLLSSASTLQESYWLTNVIYCLVIVVAGSGLYLFPNLDLSILYCPVLPLLGAGFILIPFVPELTVFLPLTLLQAGFALFDLYTWLLFAYIAKYYQRPTYVFGWGMFLITISIFAGETIFAILFAKISFLMKEIEILSVCAALLMMAGTLLFQGKRDSFCGWEAPRDLVTEVVCLEQTSPEQTIIAEIASTLEIELDQLEERDERDVLGELDKLDERGETGLQKLERLKSESVSGPMTESTSIDAIREQFLLSLKLTKREREVTLLLFEGRNNPYIRASLNISNNTLKTHLKNIYRKAMVKDRQRLLDLYKGLV